MNCEKCQCYEKKKQGWKRSLDISNKLWDFQSKHCKFTFMCSSFWDALAGQCTEVSFFILKCTYDEMLPLLIITLTNAPNNSSVCTVSQQEGAVTMMENENYWLNTEIFNILWPVEPFLVLNSASLTHKGS